MISIKIDPDILTIFLSIFYYHVLYMSYRFFKLNFAISCLDYPKDIGCVVFTQFPKFTEIKFYLKNAPSDPVDLSIYEFITEGTIGGNKLVHKKNIMLKTNPILKIPNLSIEQIKGRYLVLESPTSKFSGPIGVTSSQNIKDYEKKLKS